MKKILFVLVACLLVSGCNEKVTCTYSSNTEGIKMDAEISAPVKSGKISSITTKLTMEFDDKKTAEEYCKNAKDSDDDMKVSCNGKKVTLEGSSENKDEAVTKKEFIESMEDTGYKCK